MSIQVPLNQSNLTATSASSPPRDGLLPCELAAQTTARSTAENCSECANLSEWIHHVETVHHKSAREHLPRLCLLSERVAASYRDQYPALSSLAATCAAFYGIMKAHLLMEEALLFPLLRELDNPAGRARLNRKQLGGFVRALEMDCKELEDLLDQIRSITSGFPACGEATPMLGVLLRVARTVEDNSRQHLQEERTQLLPCAVAALATADRDTALAG